MDNSEHTSQDGRICSSIIQPELSCKMRNMSFLCALMVVLIHALPDMNLEGWLLRGGSKTLWIISAFLKQGVCQMAVPFFFLASGFFLAGVFHKSGWYLPEVFKRVKSLLIPFFMFNILYWLWISFCGWVGNGDVSVFVITFQSAARIVGLTAQKPVLGALWFVRCLFLLVLVSPLIFFFMKKKSLAQVWIFVCLFLYGLFAPWGWYHNSSGYVFFYCISFVGLFWFSLGCYFRCYGESGKLSWWVSGIIGVGLIVLRIVLVYFGFRFAYYLGWFSIPFLMHFVWSLVPTSEFRVSFFAFPLYILHRFLLTPLQMINSDCNVLICGVNFLCAVSGSILVLYLLKEISPRLVKILFGGRVRS